MDESDRIPNRAGSVSLHDRRMSFPAAPEPDRDDRAVFVGIKFVAEFEGGRRHSVDLTAYPLPGVARDAARVLWSESRPLGSYRSPGALESAVMVLRAFATFLLGTGREGRVTLLASVTIDDISAFETWLRAKHGREHYLPYQRMSLLRKFLRLAHRHGFASEAILPRLEYVADGATGTRTKGTRDAYSGHVARQLREAAWKDVEAAVERITAVGPRLAADGVDPEVGGWSEANIAWAASNRGLATLVDHPEAYGLIRKNGSEQGFRGVVEMFHLTADDAFAFWVLLSLGIGIPIESIRELKADCLRNESRGYANLHYMKRRRGMVTEAKKRIKVDGTRSPGAVVKLILTLTHATRCFASVDDAQWLFVGYGYQSDAKGAMLRRLMADGAKLAITRFCSRHTIMDDKGQRLSRIAPANLRKTFKAAQYAKANGHLAEAADDHSKVVHVRNYANVPALAPLHEATVAEGLMQALSSAMAPIALTEADERRVETDPEGLTVDTGLSIKDVQAVASGEGDVWFATCLGFDKSPYAVPGERHCPLPVWGCLGCRNAVITSSKLPAIIAFLNHILLRRQEMNLKAWAERFGVAHHRITAQILPRFPEREVALARAVAEAESDLVWLPAELTMTR